MIVPPFTVTFLIQSQPGQASLPNDAHVVMIKLFMAQKWGDHWFVC